jgi:hypothetical protein
LIKEAGGKVAYRMDSDFTEGVKEMWPKVLKWLRSGDTNRIQKNFQTSKQEALMFIGNASQIINQHKDLLKEDKPYLLGSVAWHAEVDANLKRYSKRAGWMMAAWAGAFPDRALKMAWPRETFPGLEEWWSESKR